MSSFDPFKWLYSFLGYCEELWQKAFKSRRSRKGSRATKPSKVGRAVDGAVSSASDRFRRSFLYRSFTSLVSNLALLPTWVDSSLGEWFRNSSTLQKIGKPFSFVFQVSLVEPLKWLVQVTGLGFQWLISRNWKPIALTAIPSCMLLLMMFLVWYGGRLDRRALAGWYRQLGEAEIQQSEVRSTWNPDARVDDANSNPPPNSEALAQEDSTRVSPYGEMLFRRYQLLEPRQRSQLVIAWALMQQGEYSSARVALRKLAPDGAHRDARAHAMMALSHLSELQKTGDTSLIPKFRHHAEGALRWSHTPKEVFLFSANLDWQSGDFGKALRTYQLATEENPEVNVILFQRANAIGQNRIAEAAQRKAIEHYERQLARNPRNEQTLIDLALILGTSEGGAVRAEKILNEAISLRPSRTLIRALSELYRIRFVALIRSNEDIGKGFLFLDRAMEQDPTNPNVAENIAAMMNRDFGENDEIRSALHSLLATGQAPRGTHAMLAEYYLAQNMVPQAMMHLEQVFQLAPTAIKFTNYLAEAYLKVEQLEKALYTAQISVELLQSNDQLKEKYADDLLDTLGQIHEELNQLPEAVENYQLCLELNANRIQTRQRLASVFRQLGDESSAETQERIAESIQRTTQNTAQNERSAAKLATTLSSDLPQSTQGEEGSTQEQAAATESDGEGEKLETDAISVIPLDND